MAELYNPFNRSVAGVAQVGQVPVQLRVESGTASRQQVMAVQAVYVQFARRATFSQVPNPVERGSLDDGSVYRITTVGNSTTVQLWPADTAEGEDANKGVLVRGGRALFLLGYINGRWRFKRVQSCFGGSGLWVSADSKRYFTDANSNGPESPAEANRQHGPQGSKTAAPKSATSIAMGMAYGDCNGGLGFIGANGKYVQIAIDAASAVVAEADLIPVSEIGRSPETVKLTPVIVATLPTGLSNGMELAKVMGRGFESRLRSGNYLSRAVVDVDSPTGIDEKPTPDQKGWISEAVVANELLVEVSPNGGYSVRVNPVGQASMSIITPEGASFKPEFPHWAVTFEGSQTLGEGQTHFGPMASPREVGWGALPVPLSTKKEVSSTWRWSYDYRFNRSAPVFLGHGWDDERVLFTLESEDSQSIRVLRDARNMRHMDLVLPSGFMWFYFVNCTLGDFSGSNDPPGWWRLEVDWELGDRATPESRAEALQEWEAFKAPPLLSTLLGRESDVTRRTGSIVSRKTLKTPWGPINLLNIDAAVTIERTEALYEHNTTNLVIPERVVVASVSGEVASRKIIHCDPLLDLIAYVEIVTTEFSPSGTSVTTADSIGAVVMTRQGRAFHRQPVGQLRPLTVTREDWLVTVDSISGSPLTERNIETIDSFIWAHPMVSGAGDSPEQVPATVEYSFDTTSYPQQQSTMPASLTFGDYPLPIQEFGGLPDFTVRSAIDPGSGAGVTELLEGGRVIKAWALPPKKGATPIEQVLPISPGQMTGFIASA